MNSTVQQTTLEYFYHVWKKRTALAFFLLLSLPTCAFYLQNIYSWENSEFFLIFFASQNMRYLPSSAHNHNKAVGVHGKRPSAFVIISLILLKAKHGFLWMKIDTKESAMTNFTRSISHLVAAGRVQGSMQTAAYPQPATSIGIWSGPGRGWHNVPWILLHWWV